MKPGKQVYFENLDGLRFWCFLSVFLYHSFATPFIEVRESSIYQFIKFWLVKNGNLGVNFFFVLSGFLITYLLISEQRLRGAVDLTAFWKRRALRIWPLFYLCVLFGFFVFPLLKTFFGQVPNETARLGYYLVFLNNFDFVKNGLPDASVLGVLWSVAVEEQFYLFWPLLIIFIPERYYLHAFLVVVAVSIAFRALHHHEERFEFHTLSCIGDLAIGGIGAVAAFNDRFITRFSALTKIYVWFIYLGIGVWILFKDDVMGDFLVFRIIERPIIAMGFLAVILEQNFCRNSIFKCSHYPVISRLGVMSFGLYCYHFIGILIMTTLTGLLAVNDNLWVVLLVEPLGALAITVVISWLSFQYFESFFLRARKKYAYIQTR